MKSYDALRRWLVIASLILTGSYFTFLIVAPATYYPLSFNQALQLVQVILPIFVGYLGAATMYVFQPKVFNRLPVDENPLLGVVVKGPVLTAAVLSVSLFLVFGVSNWPTPGPATGAGMPFDVLSSALSLILSFHTATTSAAVAYLFGKEAQFAKKP